MTLRSKSWQRGGAGSPSRRRHIPAELGGAARAGRRPGASPQLPEGADLEEAPRRRRLSEEVGPLTAEPGAHRISLQERGASGRAPQPSVPPALRARPSPPTSTREPRRHGRLGLQPAGRGQVRLHPRYARPGDPRAVPAWAGGASRAGACRAPRSPRLLSLPIEAGVPRCHSARCSRCARCGQGCFGKRPGWSGEAGAGRRVGHDLPSSAAPASGSRLSRFPPHPGSRAQRHLALRPLALGLVQSPL